MIVKPIMVPILCINEKSSNKTSSRSSWFLITVRFNCFFGSFTTNLFWLGNRPIQSNTTKTRAMCTISKIMKCIPVDEWVLQQDYCDLRLGMLRRIQSPREEGVTEAAACPSSTSWLEVAFSYHYFFVLCLSWHLCGNLANNINV